jgi:hypothetical protein
VCGGGGGVRMSGGPTTVRGERGVSRGEGIAHHRDIMWPELWSVL